MAQLALTDIERETLKANYPAVFEKSFWQRHGIAIGVAVTVVYLAFCFVFFNVGSVISEGRWDRAGAYLQDWYSWRAQPRLKLAPGEPVEIAWNSRAQYRTDEPIDWLFTNPDGSVTATFGSDADRIVVTPEVVTVYLGGTPHEVTLGPDGATMPQDAPGAMTFKTDKVLVDFGFAGSAEIRGTQVYIQRRFLGWANFWFDTKSAFWGMGLPQVVWTIVAGERIDPNMSNLELAWDDFLGNSVWQHADILSKLGQTIVMAFVGTLLGTLVAAPLAFIAARNITPNAAANWMMKRIFDLLRSIDMLIWALFFTRSFGPGPIPGIAAIFFTDTGALGKVYAEALENIDDKEREGVKSVGAHMLTVQRYGVVPQVLPVFISQSLYFWESNIRSATVIGAVGAGGIGLKLLEAMKTNADWDKVAYMVVLILIVVFVFDNISNALRSRLIGAKH
ncbi:phosphonate ABC transporter, permease protein PhnE [Youhaiella tibetensis]|uniref:Phosphonate ABC transporter, permease protein PhnE n=1 Tax=Paradevosia tibetensis TaxID=1447062 RepID=A0A5B9DQI9_9HYPH|nr:phosphonate ABC transporter, permease protein PhnE [Youhaiella tibetensis]QEE21497.1 phosphonate ABC transporter, permease protein PhnE [Youhaiella tibetensis]GGF14458.1 phosphonate ABC transporter, permease protein PhnE [Youhaiella tibetensis]